MNKAMVMLTGFGVKGNVRFLSHTEMAAVIQRACARAGIRMSYTEGYNPHPRMSLPLPRPVGVESDCELLYLRIEDGADLPGEQDFRSRLQGQMPDGVEILDVRPPLLSCDSKTRGGVPQPVSAKYIIKVQEQFAGESLKQRIEQIKAAERIEVQRNDPEARKNRTLDVRPYVQSIGLEGDEVVVECKVGQGGSIRVDEILGLLGLNVDRIAGPVRRTYIQWQKGCEEPGNV